MLAVLRGVGLLGSQLLPLAIYSFLPPPTLDLDHLKPSGDGECWGRGFGLGARRHRGLWEVMGHSGAIPNCGHSMVVCG